MRIFHIQGDTCTELPNLPDILPIGGYVWLGTTRSEFETGIAQLQAALQRWTSGQLVDLHISDLLNQQLPSHYDYTSWYDMLVFRRLAAAYVTAPADDPTPEKPESAHAALAAIDTNPVGFALFDRVLLTVHPADCQVQDHFAHRLHQQTQNGAPASEGRSAARLPQNAADLMLRMINHMVDGYLELRRLLARQFGHLQQQLLQPGGRFKQWDLLLNSRNALHVLEDTCEDQRSAITEWIDALDEWPEVTDASVRRERELLRVRSRDVLEHIDRVLTHVRRLESSAETAVQMHFSAQSNRTNDIMRTLTVLTAIFLPLNLVTGFFGMNFEALPLIHSITGFWVTASLLVLLGVGVSLFFWRKRYIGHRH